MARRPCKLGVLSALVTLGVLALVGTASAAQQWTAAIFPRFLDATETEFETLGGTPAVGWGYVQTTVGSTPAAPRNLTVPQGLVTNNFSFLVPVPTNPNLISFGVNSVGELEAATFVKDGGPGSFAFCPGISNPANPNCTNPGAATAGNHPRNGLIRYTAGPNQFGGTMQFLWTAQTVTVVVKLADPNPTTPFTLVNVRAVPRGGPGKASVIGGPYANVNSTPLPTTLSFRSAGQFTASGARTSGPAAGGAFPGPGDLIRSQGFPWTTGVVYGRETLNTVSGENGTLTLTGYDNRNASGIGNVSMVAAGLTDTLTTEVTLLTTRITYQVPEPGVMLGLASGAVLLGGLHLRRRQRDA